MSVPAAKGEPTALGDYDLAGSDPPRTQSVARHSPGAAIGGGRQVPVRSDGSSRASNPAQLYIETGQYLRCHMFVIGFVAIAMSLCSVGMLFFEKYQWLWWVPLLMLPIIIWTQLSEQKKQMASGNVCPAVVIKDAPYRVAVYTDLSTEHGSSHPAIYVMNAGNLVHAPGGRPKVGERLTAVAYYSGPPKNGSWQGFSPTLVVTVTRNVADTARIDASVPQEEWDALESALEELSDANPGLYRLT
ncbi:MAG TPA: DUF3239 domain-containing protein [Tepidisphaeraceae bacterium]|nr:DUF3239 domain-containing protein [Tepidisphaeraceae bacterium]